MERKIGEIFEYNGEWYQCIIGHCNQCSFDEAGTCKFIGYPYCAYRNDKKLACFKKLEKVGEPYPKFIFGRGNIKVQRYKLYRPTNTNICNGIWIYHWNENLVDIEIKQNKEDMEENKLNLKPFNLEEAKAGKPVCTRDGRKARIICFDRDWDMHIVALVADPIGETVHYYLSNGKVDFDKPNDEDLMMLPEKKEGWINVYKGLTQPFTSVYPKIYKSKEEAINDKTAERRIDTIKIKWEK